jgi:hypothetical protein
MTKADKSNRITRCSHLLRTKPDVKYKKDLKVKKYHSKTNQKEVGLSFLTSEKESREGSILAIKGI